MHVINCMASIDSMAENDVDNELLDYEEDEEPQGAPESAAPASKKEVKGSYVSIHSSGFRDFLLKPELLRAIVDCGFEHPSEGECLRMENGFGFPSFRQTIPLAFMVLAITGKIR